MRIFFDTSPFIYLLEDHPKYGQLVNSLILDEVYSQSSFITSVITLAEFGVVPMRNNRPDIIAGFEQLIDTLPFEMINIERKHATLSFQLRSSYPGLKAFDALQIASAILSGCDQFLTNDYKLKNISEIKVVTIDEFVS